MRFLRLYVKMLSTMDEYSFFIIQDNFFALQDFM